MKNILIAIISITFFTQCTQENEVFVADSWHGTYETTINNRGTRLSPVVIDRSGNLTIAGEPVFYHYDVYTHTIMISDMTINREKIHFANLVFSLDGSANVFEGEIVTDQRISSGTYKGRESR